MFLTENLKSIPWEFWRVAAGVRIAISKEQKRRTERQARIEALTGETPE